MTTESEAAAAELVAFLRAQLGSAAVIQNIDDGDVIITMAPSGDAVMIHVEWL